MRDCHFCDGTFYSAYFHECWWHEEWFSFWKELCKWVWYFGGR